MQAPKSNTIDRRAMRRGRRLSKVKSETQGIAVGTLIATAQGWCKVEDLTLGDSVWTFDDGLQRVTKVTQQLLWANQGRATRDRLPIWIPALALANECDLICPPDQGLLLECEKASDAMGDPYAIIPIETLIGLYGIKRVQPEESVAVFTLEFEREQAIFIDSGLLMHCPVSTEPQGTQKGPVLGRYDVKTVREAKVLLTDLDLAELALREPYEEFFCEERENYVA